MLNYYDAINQRLMGEKTIFVLRGFPFLILSHLKYEWLVDLDYIDAFENDIDLSDYRRSIIPKISKSLSGDDSYVLMFEQFMLLGYSITDLFKVYGYQTVILQNNLYSIYFPVAGCLTNHMKWMIDDESLASHQITSAYSEYLVLDGINFIQYTDTDNRDEFKIINLFDNSIRLTPEPAGKKIIDYYLDENEENFAADIFKIGNGEKKDIVIGSHLKLSEYQLFALGCLSTFGYHFHFALREIQPVANDFSKYLSILHRRNSTWDFKQFNVYTSPGYSLETTQVSQGTIIDTIVRNSVYANRGEEYYDVFVTAPTGAGKSILFQIPAIHLAEEYGYVTLIISPLIGLMNDQVYNIADLTDQAATINSDYTPDQKEEIKNKMRNGELSILYLSPEALISISNIQDIVGNRKIGLFVIDEAHIVSTWGKSFRPDYWYLGDYINRLRGKLGYHFPIATFSATITYGGVDDMHIDIINSLHMRTGPNEYIGPVRRENIGFDIRLHEKINDYRDEKHKLVVQSIKELASDGHKTLVYFPFVSHLKDIGRDLKDQRVNSVSYYGGEDKVLKDEALNDFRSGKCKTILCTKAFGMGIDIDDIDVVYHYAPTGNLCDYIQEIGRCARDKNIYGNAVTDYFDEDFRYINQLYGMSAITNYQVIATLKKLSQTYYQKKSRNFTISPDDYSFIFAERNDMSRVDAQLKTTLLMIQKDFENDPWINFRPIIFKPRSLFTKGYVMIEDSDIKQFKNNRLFKYFEKYRTKDEIASNGIVDDKTKWVDPVTGKINNYHHTMHLSVKYMGDIYTVDFKKMWEKEYNELSFAQFKYQFFSGQLRGFEIAEKLKPEYILHVKASKASFRECIDGLSRILLNIRDQISANKDKDKMITIDGLGTIIEGSVKGVGKAEAQMAAVNYINIMNAVDSENSFTNSYVFKHRENYDDYSVTSYAVLNKKTYKIINSMKHLYGSVIDLNEKTFLVNLSKSSKNQSKKILSHEEFIVAQLFEIFRIAEYDVTSGERPEYFIRINSIRAIERILANPNYRSEMVRMAKERHLESVKIMKKFFTQLNDDDERWDFIERYFVGLDQDNVVSE